MTINELEKLLSEATPGKWSEMSTIIDDTGDAFILIDSEYLTTTDAELIYALRNAAPALIEAANFIKHMSEINTKDNHYDYLGRCMEECVTISKQLMKKFEESDL